MKRGQVLALLLAVGLLFTGCSPAGGEKPSPSAVSEAVETDGTPTEQPSPPPEESAPIQLVGDIWLYGEEHGVPAILDEELRLWQEAYARGVRHLFVEYPYYTAEFFNLWMAAEDDAILEEVYNDWAGTQAHVDCVKEFYQAIKATCPETVFHGTDVGHQYDTTGARYLAYLEEKGREDSPQYRLAQDQIAQGRKFYAKGNVEYRETMMTENLIRELESLEGEEIVGFYGAAHTGTSPFGYDDGTVEDTMASRLLERYGEKVHLTDLSYAAIPAMEPERVDEIQVGDKTYEASCFGKVDISAWSKYLCREFWRLEGAYDDLKDAPKTGQVLPYDNYPTRLEEGQVYVIDYTNPDGTVERKFYRSDGDIWQGLPTTVEIDPFGEEAPRNGT